MHHSNLDNAQRIARLWRRVRWGAALFVVVQFLMYAELFEIQPLPLRPVGLAIGGSFALINLVAARHEARRPRNPRGAASLARRDLWLLAIDVTFNAGIVLLFAFDPGSTWVILALPILEAGLLGRMRLGLLTWALSLVVLIVEPLLATAMTGVTYSLPATVASVTFRAGVLLLVALVVASAAEITHEYVDLLQTARERLQHQATHDDLTGLPGRTLFMDRANSAMGRGDGKNPIGVAFVDCDRFKEINDQYGHAAGDVILQKVAARLSNNFRNSDTVARMGGDEFAVLLDGGSPGQAENLVDAARATLAQPYVVPGLDQPIPMTCTIGLALGTAVGSPAEIADLLEKSDADMYARKSLLTKM